MSNTPPNPNPSDKGPWIYSGSQQPPPGTPAYVPPGEASTPPPPPPTAPPEQSDSADDSPGQKEAPRRPSYARPAAPPAKPAARSDDASLSSIVDTIEAIIIALILALTFRAFVIEAFVIPTGSMAPTLLGAHFNVVCPECGYTFSRDASLRFQMMKKEGTNVVVGVGDRAELVSNSNIPCDGDDPTSLLCPNCQYVIPYNLLPQYLGAPEAVDVSRNRGRRQVPLAWANNGDRILVLKYIYSLMEPRRFDVIVFKEPMRARDNYIKRLIGLPGETIEIIGGDVFVGPAGKTSAADRLIARKPPHVQKDLWQLVYDNDFYPRDEGPAVAGGSPYSRRSMAQPDNYTRDHFSEWHNPWTGAGATAAQWNHPDARTADGQPVATVGGPVVRYAGNAPGSLQFNPEHRDPYTYNILGYNNDIHDLYHKGATLLPVGDLRLAMTWTPTQDGAESVALTVGAARNQVRAAWSREGLELSRFDPENQKFAPVTRIAAADLPPLKAGKAYDIALNNVDHSAQFFINGKMVLSYDTPFSAVDALKEEGWVQAQIANRRGSKLDALAPKIEIDVAGACTLGHLKLWRDLYYTQTEQGNAVGRFPGAANTGQPLTLGDDEFFALGDNSRRSHDGRTWNEVFPALDDLGTTRGIVPRRYLLGKAVFVYWPAGFRFTDSLPHVPPLVPNTGDMRFIR